MKKRIITLITVFCLTMSMLYGLAYAKEEEKAEKREVFFFSHATEKEEEYLISKSNSLDNWADSIRKSNGNEGEVIFGKPISIRNVPQYDCFFVPVFINSKCISVITLGVDPTGENGGYCMSMNGDFAQAINDLPNGTYYFEYDPEIDATCIIGTETKIIVQSYRFIEQFDNISTGILGIEKKDDEKIVDINSDVLYTSESETEANRSWVTVALNIGPIYHNTGNFCWLCCAGEISEYYGATAFSLTAGHFYVHPLHTYTDCTGGTLGNVNAIVHMFAGKQGTSAGALLASNTVTSIAGDKPIYSTWFYSGEEIGHGMVIAGYKYNSDNYDFKYIIHDPNLYSAVDLQTSFYATSVSYYMNSHYYTWTQSLYNWS